MNHTRLTRIICVVCLAAAATWNAHGVRGQAANPTAASPGETEAEAKERVTAERFLALLKRRPRLGTALDKVYGYHVARGTLEDFAQSLAQEAADDDDGKLWLILGMVQMQRGQDAQAAAALEKAEQRLPDEPLAGYYLGKTLVVLGEVDQAAAAMRRAIERKPARADLLAMFQDLGRIYQRTGRNQEALDVWKQLESLFPTDLRVREQIASILAEEGAGQEALARYTALAGKVKDRFRQVELAIRAAQLKAELGQQDEALADFEQLLARVNPESWLHRDVRRRIEQVFWTSGDIDGLVEYYSQWIEKHPDDVDAMMRAASVLSAQRRLPEAEKWFQAAISKAPSLAEPRLALVEALAADDRYADAARAMGALVKLQPDNPDYIVRWGELVYNDTKRSEQTRRDEAGNIWRRMLEKRGSDPVTVARVADLLRASGSTEAAIEQYRAAIELAPDDPQYREYLGEYLHQLDRQEEALAVWRELAAGQRRTRDNLVRLSEVLGTFRHDEEALAVMAEACELKPTFGHRARYAQLLREDKQYDKALAQLELAEPLAEDPELRELVIEERIKSYQASGELEERIEQAETAVAGPSSDDPAAWRLLALLRNADRKFQLACQAIEKATELASGDVAAWETAAMLQQRAGRFGDAITSYRKLATLDRRYLTNYLTQIASLEMQLGNAEAAIKAAEELIVAAPGNSESYRFFADLCFRAGRPERAFDVLRRNVRANPNDRDATEYLARVLAENFETGEAMELYWRAFELSRDVETRIAVVEPLASLYLRTNRFEAFTDRLETIGREQNKSRDAILWVAAAHRAAGDLGMAKTLLERLVREDGRDTKLLEQLVQLARAEFDFESAGEYQKRLVAVAPSPQAEYLLGNILLELGQLDEAEVLWLKLSQRSGNPQALTASISTLLGKGHYETLAKIVERAMAQQPDNWELLAPAMIAYVKLDRLAEARGLAERALALTVEPAEPTKKISEAIKKRAARNRNRAYAYNPYADLGQPSQLLQTAQRIKQTIEGTGGRYSSNRQQAFEPNCFQDVQALAYSMPLLAPEEGFDAAKFIQQAMELAVESRDPERLWRAIFYLAWQDPSLQYGPTSADKYTQCLDVLIELEDPFAASNRIAQMVNQRRNGAGGDLSKLAPLKPDQVEQLKRWSQLAGQANSVSNSRYTVFAALELSRAGEDDAADELVDQYVALVKSLGNSASALMQAVSFYVSEHYNPEPSDRAIDKALALSRQAIGELKMSTSSMGAAYGQQMGGVLAQLMKRNRVDEALELVDRVLQWQADQTADMRPALRRRIEANRRPIEYGRVVKGRYVRETVAFPPVSAYFGGEAILTLYALHDACGDDDTRRAKIDKWINRPRQQDNDSPHLQVARSIAQAAWAYWSGDHERAADTLSAAGELQLEQQFVLLARTRILYDAGKVREALNVIESLRPTNQRMLVDRELAILQLLLQLGDLERAKQSAGKLFALRLDSDTEFKLSDLMYQLGMRELGERMMDRIRRRAGGKQDTLVQLMKRYADANDNEAAAEIARQVIRRTSPATSQYYYSAAGQQHEQAVRVLARIGQLDPLIEQYEALVERSPKSTKLVDKLSAFYAAAGRRDDAQKLRLKAVENAPNDPRSLYAAGQQLASLRKYSEAADKFVAAIVKSPDLLDQNYYEMRTAFEEAKAWNRLSEAIVRAGIPKFRQTYRIGEVCSELLEQENYSAVNKLLYAILSELDWPEASQAMHSIGSRSLKPDAKLIKLVGDKLADPSASFENLSNNTFAWSRGSDGETTGFVDGIAAVVSSDQALRQRVTEAMSVHLDESPEVLFPRVLTCLLHAKAGQPDDVRKTIQPLLDKQDKTLNDGTAVWSVASTLAHKVNEPELACKLLEAVDFEVFDQRYSSSFRYSAPALLVYAYEKSGRNADAHRMLIEQLKTATVDESRNQYNPGYGEYEYINSLRELAERFLRMGYPAEAFIAYRKAFGNEDVLARAKRYSSVTRWEEPLRKRVMAQRTTETMLRLLGAMLTSDEDVDEATRGAAAFLTEPQIQRNSLIDNRVSMPLEEFTAEIARQEALRDAVARWLRDTPLPEQDADLPLKTLVTRLLICDAVEDQEQVKRTAEAIVHWVDAHHPPEASSEADANQQAAQPASGQPLPDELLLALAVRRMPAEATDAPRRLTMLERAMAAAKASDEPALAASLQCRAAAQMAANEPDRARTIFLQALDELLPADDQQASPQSGQETP